MRFGIPDIKELIKAKIEPDQRQPCCRPTQYYLMVITWTTKFNVPLTVTMKANFPLPCDPVTLLSPHQLTS